MAPISVAPTPTSSTPCQSNPLTAVGLRLCGPAHDLVWEDAAAGPDHVPDSPAILFADQNKAFERVSYPWLTAVLRRWGFDDWVLRFFLALSVGRSVVSARAGPNPKGAP